MVDVLKQKTKILLAYHTLRTGIHAKSLKGVVVGKKLVKSLLLNEAVGFLILKNV
jgi:hypothetical protein